MLSKRKIFAYLLPIFILLLTITSVNLWSSFPLPTVLNFTIWVLLLLIVLLYKKIFFQAKNKSDYKIIHFYFFWMIFGVTRGLFIAENYWEWKQLFAGTMFLTLPIFIYVFSIPWLVSNVIKFWLRYSLIIFLLVYSWNFNPSAYQFYFGLILVVGCFLPIIPNNKWRYIIISILLLMFFLDFGVSRSQGIKTILCFLTSLSYLFIEKISKRFLKIFLWLLIASPPFLIYLGVSGKFNVFENLGFESSSIKTNLRADKTEELKADTRTFIYTEVIGSALKHNYFWLGRSPALGNDSALFGESIDKDKGTDKRQRFRNEVNFPNVFTWLGFIGMLLYCAIYVKSAYLSFYKSRNIFLKLVGVFIAFHFFYGWIEDVISFDILNISNFMMIGIGFSEEFRNMTNREFKNWFKNIFQKNLILFEYEKY